MVLFLTLCAALTLSLGFFIRRRMGILRANGEARDAAVKRVKPNGDVR